MKLRVVLYSAIYGGYDIPKPLPEGLKCDRIMFTDDPDLQAPGWKLRVVPRRKISTYMLRHKYVKCQPDILFPHHDIALWVDGSITIKHPDYVELCIDSLGNDDAAFVKHPWRDCIYEEASYSAQLPRYQGIGIEEQAEFYRHAVGHPEKWGLFATGANARRIHTEGSYLLGRYWWDDNLNWTHQDQISLPVLVRHMGDKLRWNTNMPWAQWWGIAEHVPWSGDFKRE